MAKKSTEHRDVKISEILLDPLQASSCSQRDVSNYAKLTDKYENIAGVVVGMSENGPQLIYGYAVLEAYRKNGARNVPAAVTNCCEAEQAELELRLSLLRETRDIVSESRLIWKLIHKLGVSRSEVLKITGKSKSWLSRRENFTEKLSQGILDLVIAKIITPRTAEELMRLPEKQQLSFATKVIDESLTKSETESLISQYCRTAPDNPERDKILTDPISFLPARAKSGHRVALSVVIRQMDKLIAQLLCHIAALSEDELENVREPLCQLHRRIISDLVPTLSGTIVTVSPGKPERSTR